MKIAIVGAHRANRLDAPYNDAEWRIWSCSPSNMKVLPRTDVWFEIHRPDQVVEFNPAYLDWLKTPPLVYRQGAPINANDESYPIERVFAEFGRWFFTCTISYMMALAMLEKPEAIGLWGISACREYRDQQPSILHFVALAASRGIEVTAPGDLLNPPAVYAFTDT